MKTLFAKLDSFAELVLAQQNDITAAIAPAKTQAQAIPGDIAARTTSVETTAKTRAESTSAALDGSLAELNTGCDRLLADVDAQLQKNPRLSPEEVAERRARAKALIEGKRTEAATTIERTKKQTNDSINGIVAEIGPARDKMLAGSADITKKLDDTEKKSAGELQKLHDEIKQTSDGARREAKEKVAALRKQLATVKQNVESTAKTASESVNSLASTTSTSTGAARTTAGGALDAASLATKAPVERLSSSVKLAGTSIEDVQGQLRALVTSASEMIDGLVKSGVDAVNAIIAPIQQTITAAMATLDGIVAQIAALRAKVLAPLDALPPEIEKLQTLLETIMGTITGVVTKANDLLGAIPAKDLPKPLVNPAMQAIQKAVTQISQQLNTIGGQVATQMKTAQDQISKQVQTVVTTAVKQVDTVQQQLVQQLSTMAKPILEAAAKAQSEIQKAVAQFVKQVDDAKQQALKKIDELQKPIVDKIEALRKEVGAALDKARGELDKAVQAALDQVRKARDTVMKTISDARAQITKQMNAAVDQVQKGVDAARKARAELEAKVAAQIDSLVQGFQKQLDTLKAQLLQGVQSMTSGLGAAKDALLAPVAQFEARLADPALTDVPIKASTTLVTTTLSGLSVAVKSVVV